MRKLSWLLILALLAGLALSACTLPTMQFESLTCDIAGGTVTYTVRFQFPPEGEVYPPGLTTGTHQLLLMMVQGEKDADYSTFPPTIVDDLPVAASMVQTGLGVITITVTFPDPTIPLPPAANVTWPLAGQQFYVIMGNIDAVTYFYISPTFTCKPVETGEWFSPGDNRINPSPSARGVIYPHKFVTGDGLEVYALNEQNQWVSALVITPEMLAGVPDKPEGYTFIARAGNVELYKLPTGQYQLNVGPDVEGKIMVTIFDDIYAGTPWYEYTVNMYDMK